MALTDFINDEKPEEVKIPRKPRSLKSKPEPAAIVLEPEIDNDEALSLVISLCNGIFGLKGLRNINEDELIGIKSSIGNTMRIIFRYIGGYKAYIDIIIVVLAIYGLYSQRLKEKEAIENIKPAEAEL